MDETELARTPLIVYGVNLLLAALAYYVLQLAIFRREGSGSLLRQAVGRDLKGKLSPVVYVLGILGTFLSPWLGIAAYVVVAVTWLVPDRRAERFVHEHALED